MIDKNILKQTIIEVLHEINMHSDNAVNLLMGTAAQESNFKYVRQIGGGPALGYFQMEPATFKDICNKWLIYQDQKLWAKVYELCNVKRFHPDDLAWNVKLMIVFARFHYRRVKEELPNDLEGYANYWKDHYNTHLGKGKVSEFIENYHRFEL